jgi:hypothetical protein
MFEGPLRGKTSPLNSSFARDIHHVGPCIVDVVSSPDQKDRHLILP